MSLYAYSCSLQVFSRVVQEIGFWQDRRACGDFHQFTAHWRDHNNRDTLATVHQRFRPSCKCFTNEQWKYNGRLSTNLHTHTHTSRSQSSDRFLHNQL